MRWRLKWGVWFRRDWRCFGFSRVWFRCEGSRRGSDGFALDQDLEVIGVGQDLAGSSGVLGGNGVAVGVKVGKAGFGDDRGDQPVGAVRDLGEGFEFFFPESFGGFLAGCAMGPLIPLQAPEIGFAIGLIEVLAGGDFQEILDVPDHPFDASFLVGPAGGAGMDGKTVVAGEVQELGIEGQLGPSFEDDTLQIIIPEAVGYSLDFL